jgi:hypothetical protein
VLDPYAEVLDSLVLIHLAGMILLLGIAVAIVARRWHQDKRFWAADPARFAARENARRQRQQRQSDPEADADA